MVEWVSLKATLHANLEPRYNCASCLHENDDRRDAVEQNARLRASKGCEVPLTQPGHFITEKNGCVLRFTTCIGNWVDPAWSYYFGLYEAYKRGFLPFPGSIQDQPAKIMHVFDVIDAFNAEILVKKAEESKRKADANVPRGTTKGRRGRQ